MGISAVITAETKDRRGKPLQLSRTVPVACDSAETLTFTMPTGPLFIYIYILYTLFTYIFYIHYMSSICPLQVLYMYSL